MEKDWDTKSNEELCIEYQKTNSDKLFNYFLKRNENLIRFFYKKAILKFPLDEDELLEWGRIAVWEAMCNYKTKYNTKFTSYVTYYFKRNMSKHLREKRGIGIGLNSIESKTKLNRLRDKYTMLTRDMVSLDEIIYNSSDNEESYKLDFVKAKTLSPEEVELKNSRINYVLKQSHLPPKINNIILMYAGLTERGPVSIKEIAKELGYCTEYVRCLKNKGFEKIRRIYKKEFLEEQHE